MDLFSIIIGIVVGVAVTAPLIFFKVKSHFNKKHQELSQKTENTIQLCQQEAQHSELALNKKNEDSQNHIEKSIQTIAEVLEHSASSADITSENLANVQEQITLLTNMVDMIISLSDSTGKTSQLGVERIDSVIRDLSELTKSKDDLATILSQFKEVQEKTVAIRFIGEEAEMLALNAAIEAARAGDAGRGFAVVATAMKTLAKNSQKTTVEILDIVNNSESVINNVSDNFITRGEKLNQSIESLVNNFNQIKISVNTIQEHSKMITHDSNGISSMMNEATNATNTSVESMLANLSSVVSVLTGQSVKNISPKEAQEQWQTFDEIIDVRRAEEWQEEYGHIEGVRLSTLQTSFKQDVKKLDPKKSYLFVCRSGGRSTKAAQTAIANGIENVYNLDGGMIEWRRQLH